MTETYEAVRSILASAFRVPEEEVRPELTLEQLGLDSLALTELVLIIHEQFGVKLDSEHASRDKTVAQVADLLAALRAGSAGTVTSEAGTVTSE